MKNIHLIPTDKPSSLVLETKNNNLFITTTKDFGTKIMKFQHIYITSDEEIKEGDYYYLPRTNSVHKCIEDPTELNLERRLGVAKIILTTDQSLNGVQAIDDEFLGWFVDNPNFKVIKIEKEQVNNKPGSSYSTITYYKYKIIIPQKETKQETIEEVAKKQWGNVHRTGVLGFIDGVKSDAARDYWFEKFKAERYSEEEVEVIAKDAYIMGRNNILIGVFNKWFEQFKKK
jgi:hypothetical protein